MLVQYINCGRERPGFWMLKDQDRLWIRVGNKFVSMPVFEVFLYYTSCCRQWAQGQYKQTANLYNNTLHNIIIQHKKCLFHSTTSISCLKLHNSLRNFVLKLIYRVSINDWYFGRQAGFYCMSNSWTNEAKMCVPSTANVFFPEVSKPIIIIVNYNIIENEWQI